MAAAPLARIGPSIPARAAAAVEPGEILIPMEPNSHLSANDLAVCAALTGRRPMVESVPTSAPALQIGHLRLRLPDEAARGLRIVLRPLRLNTWVQQVSGRARRRIEEAKYRLAG